MRQSDTLELILDRISRTAPPLLTRAGIEKITDKAVSVKTLQNLDSLGRGIPERTRIGNKIVYPTTAVIVWLRQRSTAFTPEQQHTIS